MTISSTLVISRATSARRTMRSRPSVDLSHHSTVVIWCVRFSVAFGAAELS